MALGGIAIFRERYSPGQWQGLAIIVSGLLVFFRDQSAHVLTSAREYAFGSSLVVLAAIVWAAYALIQKQLLMRLTSPAIMLFIYLLASVLLFPLEGVPAMDFRRGASRVPLLTTAPNRRAYASLRDHIRREHAGLCVVIR